MFSTTVNFRVCHGEVNVLLPRFFSPLSPAFLFGGDIKCLGGRGLMYYLALGKGCLVPSEHGWLSLQYLLNMSVTWASDVWS